MVQLMVDEVTGKILGFNTIIPTITKDLILIEDEEFKKLQKEQDFQNLYYEDGKIVEKEENDAANEEIKELEKQEFLYREKVEKEQKIFMECVLDGKTMEEAAAIVRMNRQQLEEISQRKKEYWSGYEEKRQKKVVEKFEKEEKDLSNKYFLSVITAVRDENDYIEEWLDYHIETLGVEHFYIYDNESVIPVKEYLESIQYKYLDKLTIISWETSNHTQQDTCNDWLQNYGRETKWFICMDVDEFIHIKEQNKTLKEFLEENAAYSRVKCLWKHFTANGQEEKNSLPVRERFPVETDWGEEKHGGKFFAQSNRVSHFVSYVPQVRLNSRHLEYDSEKLTGFYQLNHYITKSYEEWVEKIARGSVNPAYMRKYQEFFEINPDMQYLNTGENTVQAYGTDKKMVAAQ